MALEAALHINQLDPNLPDGALDDLAEGDDVLRLIKAVLVRDFPNVGGIVTASHTELNTVTGKANKAGDTYTGAHNMTGAAVAVATQTVGDNSTQAASTAFVASTLAAISGASLDLIVAIVPGTTQQALAGSLYVLTNPAATTLQTPISPTVGQRFGVMVANGLLTNVVAYGAANIGGLAESMTINNPRPIGIVFRYINSTIGWAVSQ